MKVVGADSFKDIGVKSNGVIGRVLVEIFLVVSQVGFTMTYVYFIAS